jgi:hypothetical protein
LIAKGVLNEGQFKDFTFTHAAEMLLKANPGLIEGTALESEVAGLLPTPERTPRYPGAH